LRVCPCWRKKEEQNKRLTHWLQQTEWWWGWWSWWWSSSSEEEEFPPLQIESFFPFFGRVCVCVLLLLLLLLCVDPQISFNFSLGVCVCVCVCFVVVVCGPTNFLQLFIGSVCVCVCVCFVVVVCGPTNFLQLFLGSVCNCGPTQWLSWATAAQHAWWFLPSSLPPSLLSTYLLTYYQHFTITTQLIWNLWILEIPPDPLQTLTSLLRQTQVLKITLESSWRAQACSKSLCMVQCSQLLLCVSVSVSVSTHVIIWNPTLLKRTEKETFFELYR
jgi:hypothetical protein